MKPTTSRWMRRLFHVAGETILAEIAAFATRVATP